MNLIRGGPVKRLGEKLVMTLAFLGVFAGILSAITGASVTAGTATRWTGQTAQSYTTEGGNITPVNISTVTLTDRWTGFFGNVSGTLVLGDNTNNLFNWTYSASSGGEICVSTGSAYSFASPVAGVAATIDTAFGLGSTADNAASTFSGTCSDLTFAQSTVSAPIKITHKGLSNFLTCAITDGGGTTETDTAFCGVISSTGTNYQNYTYNYELMAPTSPGAATTEVYYFYAELS